MARFHKTSLQLTSPMNARCTSPQCGFADARPAGRRGGGVGVKPLTSRKQVNQGIIFQKQADFATYQRLYFPKPGSQPETELSVDPRLDVKRPA